MQLIAAYIFESSHIEDVHASIVGPCDDLAVWQPANRIDSSGMVLNPPICTEGNEVDFATRFTPFTGILAIAYTIRLGFDNYF